MLTENTTGLDSDDPETIQMFQVALNKYVEQTTQDCLKTVFKQLDADPVGVGQMVYNQHPYDWERLKTRWRKVIPTIRYTVIPKVKIIEGGKSGPPLYGKTHRGILNRGVTSEHVGESNP